MKALVRISSNEEVVVKRVLDAGADGLIVPMIKNNAEAKKLILMQNILLRVKGCRSVQGSDQVIFTEYKKWQESDLVISQIEHIEAQKIF